MAPTLPIAPLPQYFLNWRLATAPVGFRLLLLLILGMGATLAHATTCANAIVIDPASLPIVGQALVCGTGDDLNSTNVPGQLCPPSLATESYKNGNEALYRFTPNTTASYQLSYSGQTWSAAMIYVGCPTDNICVAADGNSGNSASLSATLTAGVTYYIWFDTWPTPNSPCPGIFSLGPPPPPITNDNPCAATPLTVNPNTPCVIQTAGSLLGATATTVPTAPCFGTPNDDVWFQFVATGPTHYISLNNVAGNQTDLYHAVYRGNCNSLINIGCSDADNSTVTGLTAGNTYWVRVYSYYNNSNTNTTFNVCISSPPPPITNDNPCDAVPLTVNPNLLCGNQTAGTLIGATATSTVPTAPCYGTPNDDVWFRFNATGPTHYISLNNVAGSPTDLYHAVYSGNCNSLTNISCSDADNSTLTGLTPGNTYWVRVYSYFNNSNPNTTFSVCVGTPPPPPANDNPCGAVALTVNPTLACATQTPGSLASATPTTTVPVAPCGGTPNDDVWFTFTATGPTHHVTLNNVAGSTTDLYHAVYSGTNCNSLTNVSCSDPNSSIVTGLISGNTYWVRVYSWSSSTGATSTFKVCIGTPPPPPPPPACGGIFYDNGGPTGLYQASSNETTTICPTVAGEMVSLIFTMFNTELNYDQLRIYDGNSTAGPLLGTFSGTALPPVLTASNPSGCLTAVFTSDGSVHKTGWAAQVLCGAMPAGDCVYALHLHDSGGNGWGSSSVGVRINGGPYTNYTVTASDNIIFIGVNLGDLIELNYSNTGPNQGQNSYSISKLGQTPYFTSLTPPTAGPTFSQIVTCGPPPALPQDCVGGITVCSSQAITNNSASTGDVIDLNSSNRGCLSGGESQGTWYYFSPQTAGNIGFSIAPANGSDDYDFALWGPFTSAQCPTGPPLRCSWNAPPSFTVGLGNGATDTSEDAGGDGWVKTIDAQAGDVYVLYIDNWSTSGQAFTLSWQLSGGTTLDCTTLPVELLSLEATARKPVIDVIWATATEQNSSHYIVERSPDNEIFTPIGSMQGAGNSQFRRDYLFVDESPYKGVNYYRLQQVDLDGVSEQTQTVTATLYADGGKPTLYPNPATNMLNVDFNSTLEGSVVLLVEDALGRTIARSTTMALRGEQKAEVPLTGLAKGWYNLRIALPDGSVMQGGVFLKQ